MNTLLLMTIYSSEDGNNWTLIDPKEVPEWLKGNEQVEALANGLGAQAPDSDTWYIGVKDDVEFKPAPIKLVGADHVH